MNNDSKKPQQMSLIDTVRAVLWSFFGIRNKHAAETDMARLNFRHVIVVAIFGAILFVLTLVLLVNYVTK